MQNFDSVFAPVSDANNTPRPAPTATAEEADLGQVAPTRAPEVVPAPPAMTLEEFKQRFPTVAATVTLNLQQQVTCFLVENKCFITCASKFQVPGMASPEARPAFLYAGGSWLSDSAKDQG